ncbi:MAG: PilZ domain-containing protein [Myxococcaceae bacterium]
MISFSSKSLSYSQARRHERLPADFLVHLRDESLRLSDRALDISEAGLGVETQRPLPPMTLISIHLETEQPIDVLGRVMWSAGGKMGIRFEQADPRVTELVDKLRQTYQRI